MMGYTISEVDKLLAPYAEKSFRFYEQEYREINDDEEKAKEYAMKKVRRDFAQGFQSWEMRFNTVGSSRGDYPFIAVSFGIGKDVFSRMATEEILKTRAGGQGKKGYKKPVLFPKLTFLYDENLHGEGKPLEYLFDKAVECSSKSMYPDFLSLSGTGYIPSIYKKYGRVISLMGKLYCPSIKNLVNLYIQGVSRALSSRRKWRSICLLTGEALHGLSCAKL